MLNERELFDFEVFIVDKKKTWTRYEVYFDFDWPQEKQMELLNKGFSPALPLFMPERPDWVWECGRYSWICEPFGLAYPINFNLYDYECDEGYWDDLMKDDEG